MLAPAHTCKLAHTLKKTKTDSRSEEHDVLDELMAKLNEQQHTKRDGGVPLGPDDSSSQTTDPFANTPPAGSTATSDSNDTTAMENMKRQLELATERMAQMELELTQTRIRQTSELPDLTQGRIHRPSEHSVHASFPPTGHGPSFTSLGAYDNSATDSRRASPLDLDSQQQALGLSGGFQSGALAPPPFFTGHK
jgi:hypothetical protein